MVNIAILGLGTVGHGVYSVLKENASSIEKKVGKVVNVKKILDIREFEEKEINDLLTKNFDDILNDSEISIVVETMGGVEPAYTFAKKCLNKGKSVVTSNKELVASCGAELLSIASKNKINFLFEASVGGGIPIIRPLNTSLAADKIEEIMGILNGTTNFILTKMTNENREFSDVLKEAQALGYAEKDPTADVCGHDTCRKIAILSSLASGGQVDFKDIPTEGITNITKTDIQYAKKLNASIKLIASAKISDGKVYASVSPVIISNNHPLSMVNDVFNAVFVKGNMVDETMFYGRGAGKYPTASAVCADIVDCANNVGKTIAHIWDSKEIEVASLDTTKVNKLIRLAYDNKDEALKAIYESFGKVETIEIEDLEFAFLTGEKIAKEIDINFNKLAKCKGVKILSMLKVQGVEA